MGVTNHLRYLGRSSKWIPKMLQVLVGDTRRCGSCSCCTSSRFDTSSANHSCGRGAVWRMKFGGFDLAGETRHPRWRVKDLRFFFPQKMLGGNERCHDVETSKDFLWYEQTNHFHSSSLPGPSPDFLVLGQRCQELLVASTLRNHSKREHIPGGGFKYFLVFFPLFGADFHFDGRIFFKWVGEKPPTSFWRNKGFFLDPETIRCEIGEIERLW